MSKYRIVKHQVRDVIRYCPEVWECRAFIGKCQESWWKLAGDENLTSLDLWVWSLPETIEEAKSIIEKHIDDQKPKYSEEVVYEYDTEKKEQQKKLLTEIMEEDQKNGLYDNHIGDTNKMITAVESFAKELIDEGFYIPKGIYDRAKQMEKEQVINACIHTASARSNVGLSDTTIYAEIELAKQYYIELAKQYYNETYK